MQVQGLPTIRAYGVAGHFERLFVEALDRNSSWWYAFLACSRWVGFRLDTLAAITLSFECILVMAVHNRVSHQISSINFRLSFLCMSATQLALGSAL